MRSRTSKQSVGLRKHTCDLLVVCVFVEACNVLRECVKRLRLNSGAALADGK